MYWAKWPVLHIAMEMFSAAKNAEFPSALFALFAANASPSIFAARKPAFLKSTWMLESIGLEASQMAGLLSTPRRAMSWEIAGAVAALDDKTQRLRHAFRHAERPRLCILPRHEADLPSAGGGVAAHAGED